MCTCTCTCCGHATIDLHPSYVIVRTQSAGVFAGVLNKADYAETVTLTHARRLWYWSGAASLSELSLSGVKNPGQCKFPAVVPEVFLPHVIEILPVTPTAQRSIAAVPVWTA